MANPFFEQPILNSPYEYPQRHWELDAQGQPTQKIVETRRRADFITPIPKPKKRKEPRQQDLVFDEGKGLSTREQLIAWLNQPVRLHGTVQFKRGEPTFIRAFMAELLDETSR